MKTAIFSDVHGNEYYFKMVLKAISSMKIERIFNLGDTVGYFPTAKAVISKLLNEKVICLRGNHENMLLGLQSVISNNADVYKMNSIRSELSGTMLANIMRKWPILAQDRFGQFKVLLVHGSPWEPTTGYVYENSNLEVFRNLPFDIFFMGHTHRPFIHRIDDKIVVNVGSVGLPRDFGELPSFAVFDSEIKECKIFRVKCEVDLLLKEFIDCHELHESVIHVLRRNGTRKVADYETII